MPPRLELAACGGNRQRRLHLLGPPLITTPRAVNRLANSYGLLSALHADGLAARRDGDEPGYRAAMVLLATLVGYPELGPVLFPHIHQQAAAIPDATWAGLVGGLHPRREGGTWRNQARASLDDAQYQAVGIVGQRPNRHRRTCRPGGPAPSPAR